MLSVQKPINPCAKSLAFRFDKAHSHVESIDSFVNDYNISMQ